MSGYCPDFIFEFGLYIEDIRCDYGGYVITLLYFPDINYVMFLCETPTCSYTFEEMYSDIPTDKIERQLYFNKETKYTPEQFYDIVINNNDIEYPSRKLQIDDSEYELNQTIYKIYIDWYNNYYLLGNTNEWKQIYKTETNL
jgi:hypothetical protein